MSEDFNAFKTEVVKRFDGVNDSIKELADAMATLVRFESKQGHQGEQIDRTLTWLDDHEKRVRELEIQGSATRVKVGVGERVLWIGLSLGGSSLTGLIVWSIKSTGGG